MPSYRPLALVAARLVVRRWALYLITCAAVFALQAALYELSHRELGKYADLFAELVTTPLVIVVVTVFVGADATNTLTMRQRWERVLERAWAIIVLDVCLSFVQIIGMQTMLSGSAADTFTGFATLLLCAMLVYAEPFIALEKEIQPLTVIPFAILRSMMLAWVNISRIFSLFAVQIAQGILAIFIHEGALRLGLSTLWTDMVFNTLIAVPLAALFTIAYLDTLAQERVATK